MNILFLTLLSFDSLQERNIYTDLLREFVKKGHKIYATSPVEKKQLIETHIVFEKNTIILRLQIGNIQKTNIIEKGISTVMIELTFKKAIKKYFSDVKFDLVLYSTPPITLVSAIEFVKKRDCAKTYLLLKDIFPQNAVDLGMLRKTGLKGILYSHFRNQEKKLYSISDKIGCMSKANVDYVLNHNPEIFPENVEICPNSIEVVNKDTDENNKIEIRKKYGIPLDKTVFVYGGNLGKPQGIPFIIECLKNFAWIEEAFFLIIGDGTEYGILEDFISKNKPQNIKIMKHLPKEDYDTMVGACDVGPIFLYYGFTIPNFPSRILSYMEARLPVLACTDLNTDIGKEITNGGFGWWCESNDSKAFIKNVKKALKGNLTELGEKGFEYLKSHYDVEDSVELILSHKKE